MITAHYPYSADKSYFEIAENSMQIIRSIKYGFERIIFNHRYATNHISLLLNTVKASVSGRGKADRN